MEEKEKLSRIMLETIKHAGILMLIGLALNFTGIGITRALQLPFYLGMLGTVFTAGMGGYLSGIIVAFATNMITVFWDYDQISFGFIYMLVAVLVDHLFHQGMFKKWWKTLITIPIFALWVGGLIALVSAILKTNPQDFGRVYLWELADMGISITLLYLALHLLPEKVRIKDHSSERSGYERVKSRVLSVRTKILIMLTLVCLMIASSITYFSYRQFRNQVIDEHIKLGRGAIQMIKGELNPARVDDYLTIGRRANGYFETEKYLYDLRDNFPDMQYVYIYQMKEDGVHVVFDLDTDEWKGDNPGDVIEYELILNKMKDDLVAGKRVEPTISNDIYGYVLSVYEPIYNGKGEVVCYACVDFSMNILNDSVLGFIVHIVTMFIGFVILIFALCTKVMEYNIIRPVNAMAYAASTFDYASEEKRLANAELLNSLDIRTGDEIENLYTAFQNTVKKNLEYIENIKTAKTQVHNMEEQVTKITVEAHTDAMTGVKNKAAFQKMEAYLNKAITESVAEFAIAMVDLNNLKKMNDTYGHDKGDIYIKGACKIVCEIFKYSPVYRFGGDEFVVVLMGKDYAHRQELLEDVMWAFVDSSTAEGKAPWEQFSAAVGMAEYEDRPDETVDTVFKRADKKMYEDKARVKAGKKKKIS